MFEGWDGRDPFFASWRLMHFPWFGWTELSGSRDFDVSRDFACGVLLGVLYVVRDGLFCLL